MILLYILCIRLKEINLQGELKIVLREIEGMDLIQENLLPEGFLLEEHPQGDSPPEKSLLEMLHLRDPVSFNFFYNIF